MLKFLPESTFEDRLWLHASFFSAYMSPEASFSTESSLSVRFLQFLLFFAGVDLWEFYVDMGFTPRVPLAAEEGA